ncbi:MAG: autotransporter outer membrane beta-barrel domain-containing protein [Alphaproteobacteria bacterium]
MTVAAGSAVLFAAQGAFAANQALEDLFITACTGAVGDMATSCGNAPGSLLSGDAESSMNPSQALTSNDLSLSRAKTMMREAQERLDRERQEKAGIPTGRNAGNSVEFGALSLFLNLTGEIFDRDRLLDIDNEKGYDGWKTGFQFGGDYRVGDKLVVGALLGYDHSESKFDPDQPGVGFNPGGDEGGTRSDSLLVNVYSSYNVTDSFHIDGTLGYGYTDYTFDRNAIFQNTARNFAAGISTVGETHGQEYSASVGMGYDFYRNAFSFGPYVRVSYSRSVIQGYTEEDRSGTGLNMTIGEDSVTSLTTTAGFQGSYAASTDWGVLVPQMRVEYEHEFDRDVRSITTSFAQTGAANSLAVSTDKPDRDYVNLGASLLFVLPNGWMPFVDVETLVSYKDLDRQRYTAGLRVEF